MPPELPEDYYTSLDELRDSFDQIIDECGDDEKYICDFCSKGVKWSSNPKVGVYLADKCINNSNVKADYINTHRILAPIMVYCEDCTTQMILFPCQGITEIRARIHVVDGEPDTVGFLDVSPADDGIPWNPRDVVAEVTGFEFDAFTDELPQVLWGPETVVTFFLSTKSGVDIREMIDHQGQIDKEFADQAQEKLKKMAIERNKQMSRQEFREHLTGDG